MTWQAPTNDSTGFWDQYGRELPGLISVPLHISVGIHAEEELTHFLQILTHQYAQQWMSVLSGTYRMKSGMVWLACFDSDEIWLSAVTTSTEASSIRLRAHTLKHPILLAAFVRIHIHVIFNYES